MTKNKKITTKIIAITSLVLGGGMVSVAAKCVTQNTLRGNGWILVQVEKEWLPHYELVRKQLLEDEDFKSLGLDIKFKVNGAETEFGSLKNKGSTDKDIAEVLAIPNNDFPYAVKEGLLFDLNSSDDVKNLYPKDSNFYNVDPYVVEEGKKKFGYPLNIESLVIYARKDSTALKDLDVLNTRTSQEQLSDLLYKVTDQSESNYGITDSEGTLNLDLYQSWLGFSFLNQLPYYKDGSSELSKLSTINETSKDNFSSWYSLSGSNDLNEKLENIYGNFIAWRNALPSALKTNPSRYFAGGTNNLIHNENFKGWVLDGPWNYNSYSKKTTGGTTTDVKIQVSALPKGIQHFTGGWGIAVVNKTSNLKAKAALMFAKKLTSESNAESFFKYTSKIPGEIDSVEKIKRSSTDTQAKELIEAVSQSFKNNTVVNEHGNSLDNRLYAVWNGDRDKGVPPLFGNTNLTNGIQVREAFATAFASYNGTVEQWNKQ